MNKKCKHAMYICKLICMKVSVTYLATYIIFMHLADAFIQSDLQCIQAIHFFVSMCVSWESNPQPLRC